MSRVTKKQRRQMRQEGLMKGNSLTVNPIDLKTDAQREATLYWKDQYNLSLLGMPGTGKTFLSFFFALTEVLQGFGEYRKVVIVRSTVPTRDVGFLKGYLNEKTAVYEAPYSKICTELVGRGDAYQILKQKGVVEFMPTAFIRGITLDNTIVIVDECQNMSPMELHSIMTRLGKNSRIIFSGDTGQDDLTSERYNEESGLRSFMKILYRMDEFRHVDFKAEDIVRSGLVKSYIIQRDKLGM